MCGQITDQYIIITINNINFPNDKHLPTATVCKNTNVKNDLQSSITINA